MLATVLIINKSFMRTFPAYFNKFASKFNWLTITDKNRNRLTSGITNDRITCITGTYSFSNIKSFDKLANTVGVTVITDITGLLTVDGFTSCPTLRTLQSLHPVVFGQTDLLTFNGLMGLLTLLVLQTLLLVTLLEQRGLLTFNGSVNWLTLLALQTLRLNVLL